MSLDFFMNLKPEFLAKMVSYLILDLPYSFLFDEELCYSSSFHHEGLNCIASRGHSPLLVS